MSVRQKHVHEDIQRETDRHRHKDRQTDGQTGRIARTFCWEVMVSCCSRCVMLDKLCSNAATTCACDNMHAHNE